jgi:hypothetical protein
VLALAAPGTASALGGDDPFISPDAEIFVLSVGYPHAPGKDSLRYPAFDAARFVETVAGVYDPVGRHPSRYLLLADFRAAADRDLFGHLAARPPTRSSLVRAVEDLNREMDASRAMGRKPVLMVFYAGHGDIGSGNVGQVYLRPVGREPGAGVGEPLTANDLRRDILERVRAERVHLMVDACNSYFLLKSRGEEASSRKARRQGRIGRRFAARMPNVGVVLSTSGVANVYESRTLQGGLFSHVLRSALSGAADLDGDLAVSYAEMEGFFAEAFRGVVNPDRYSPQVYVQPPASDAAWDQSWAVASMLTLPESPARGLEIPAGEPRHVFVTDNRGLRLAEVHADGRTPIRFWLPAVVARGGPDAPGVFRVVDGEARPVGRLADGHGWQGPEIDDDGPALQSRGVVDEVVKQMFAQPTGRGRLHALAAASALDRLEAAQQAEMGQDRYLGIRVTGGLAGRTGGGVADLGPSPLIEIGVRGESRRLVTGVSALLLLPTEMSSPESESEVVTWGGGLDGVVGYALPAGPFQIEPHLAAGPGVRLQTGGGAAWTARAAAGASVMTYLPWDTDWALDLEARVGPELLGNVEQGSGDIGVDLGWLWTVSVGADLEVPR